MKVAILCGGAGTRLREETEFRPKPMVAVGEKPILWHIMNHYSSAGHHEFVIALGYKGEVIKDYFLNYWRNQADVTVDLKTGQVTAHHGNVSEWTVHLVDTGLTTATGGRLKRLKHWLGDEPFMLTYGDGVSNVDIPRLIDFHGRHGRIATVTAVRPVARFGEISLDGDRVGEFKEKPQTGAGWINGGFLVCNPGVFDYLEGDQTVLEAEPLERLAREGELMAYRHPGFWQCMDTLRDKELLDKLWASGTAPWTSTATP